MVETLLSTSRPAEVLIAEDDDNDLELMRIGFRRSRLMVNLHQVPNGEECMAFLRKEGKYSAVPTPDLVLLDLNMPRMSGREVLKEVQLDERLNVLPIVVMTSSDADVDVLASYKLGCRSYVTKPLDFDRFAAVIKELGEYWFTLVVLPTAAPRPR